jgi:hypothetical protein
MGHVDREAGRAYQAAYYLANRDKIRQRVADWETANPGRLKASRHAHYLANKERILARSAEYHRVHPKAPYNRGLHYQLRYGITVAEYEAILEVQGGGCALCSRPPGKQRLHVDHDHRIADKRSAVRGLLCARCNMMVLIDASPEQLRRATLYLRTPPARSILFPVQLSAQLVLAG